MLISAQGLLSGAARRAGILDIIAVIALRSTYTMLIEGRRQAGRSMEQKTAQLLYRGICRIVLALALWPLLGAQPVPRQAEVRITRGPAAQEIVTFVVEIADQPKEWQRGLMERSFLAPNRGMLFVFPNQAPRAFWMMNTLIHLDIIYADDEGRILNIAANVPPCVAPRRCPTYRSIAPARYVLEIPGGRAQALGVRPGDHLRFSY